jgi:predicted nucleic acid-binding protein
MNLTFNKLQEQMKNKNCQLVLDSSFLIAQVLEENKSDKARAIFSLAIEYNSILNTNFLIWTETIVALNKKHFDGHKSKSFQLGLDFANSSLDYLEIQNFDYKMATQTAKIKADQKTNLSLADCSILALANLIPNSILLTKDKNLADSCGKQAVFRWV